MLVEQDAHAREAPAAEDYPTEGAKPKLRHILTCPRTVLQSQQGVQGFGEGKSLEKCRSLDPAPPGILPYPGRKGMVPEGNLRGVGKNGEKCLGENQESQVDDSSQKRGGRCHLNFLKEGPIGRRFKEKMVEKRGGLGQGADIRGRANWDEMLLCSF